jgi:hypothetical protein
MNSIRGRRVAGVVEAWGAGVNTKRMDFARKNDWNGADMAARLHSFL